MSELLRLLTAKNRIVNQAEKIILRKIQKYCKRYNRTVKTVGISGVVVYKGGVLNQGEEVYDTVPHKLIHDFEDNFGPFGMYACQGGRWIEGQTPLIQFKKPRL